MIRRQDDVIDSFIRYNKVKAKSVLELITEYTKGGALYINGFNYLTFCMDLAATIGKCRIEILLFEDLKENKNNFVSRMEEIFSIKLDHLYEYLVRVHGQSEKLQIPLQDRECFLEFFKESNRELDKIFNLGIDQYGYY